MVSTFAEVMPMRWHAIGVDENDFWVLRIDLFERQCFL